MGGPGQETIDAHDQESVAELFACRRHPGHRARAASRPARRTATPASLCLVLALAAPAAAGQQDVERENLAGIRDVNVIVADLADDAETAGLTRRGLLDAVEGRLEACGVRLGSSRQAADLYVDVTTHRGSTGLYAYYARVSVQQLATIEGNQLRPTSTPGTWPAWAPPAAPTCRGSRRSCCRSWTSSATNYFEVNDRRR